VIAFLAALCAIVSAVLFARTLVGGEKRWLAKRVAPHVTPPPATPAVEPHRQRVSRHPRIDGVLDATERRLRGRAWDAFCARVERADVPLRAVELLYLGGTAAFLAAALGGATAGSAAALPGPLLVAAIVWVALGARARRRLAAFEQQLPDVLATLASSLRAGHGFLQSLQAVAGDAPEPARKELRRVLAETRLGRPLEEALADLASRLPSEDLVFVVTAITVQRQVGGSLARLFESVNDVVRRRQAFARKVRALTATGRASARVLAVLPFALLGFLTAINHTYTAPLFTTQTGRLLLVASACSVGIGSLVLRRIASLKGTV
jgi:tight adherence protein B